ncbi:hypothetical protein MBENS4_1447 [Novosphingobium sp. MBES04]|nr:hypothetical protein MBENS4_1447 [Novosphingobium sp. MBES04]
MERVVHDLACGLATRYRGRIEVSVLYCHRYVELPESLPYEVFFEEAGSLRAFPRKVARQLGRDRYDVVVIAQFEPTVLVWLLHRLARGKSRFVMHLHGNPKVEGTTSRRARLAFSLFNLLVPRMDKVIAVSPALARYLALRTGHADVADYLPNPVRQFGEVVRTAGASGPVRFLTIGRLARQKGHDVLIEAFAQLIGQGVDAHLTIVGDGEERDALSAQIERLGLAGKVRLAGKIAYPAAELAEAECFVSASRWEGFGVAIVEAMSAGLPVIATDCDFGPTDLIDMPEKGEVVPAEDAGALAAAMADFASRARARAGDRCGARPPPSSASTTWSPSTRPCSRDWPGGGTWRVADAKAAESESMPVQAGGEALGGRTAGSAAWLIGGRLFTKFVEFLSLLVLAQLLTPEDFGVIAIAMTLVTIVEAVFELPITQVLIARRAISQRHLDTAFTLSALRGGALTLVVWASAVPFAHFYRNDTLVWMILALGVAPGLRGMGSPGLVLYARELKYRREIAAELVCKTGSLVCSVAAAWWLRDYRALMVGIVATPTIWILASYALAPYRPRLSLAEWPLFADFLGWTTGAQLLAAINWQCDRLILGRFVSPAQLGIYSVANDLSYVPEQALSVPSCARSCRSSRLSQTSARVWRRPMSRPRMPCWPSARRCFWGCACWPSPPSRSRWATSGWGPSRCCSGCRSRSSRRF